MNEVNVKEIELIENTAGIITKRIKPNFKTLGPRYGKYMKQIAAMTAEFSQERIAEIEAAPETILDLGAEKITVTPPISRSPRRTCRAGSWRRKAS